MAVSREWCAWEGRLKVKLIGKSHAVASMEVLVFVSSG